MADLASRTNPDLELELGRKGSRSTLNETEASEKIIQKVCDAENIMKSTIRLGMEDLARGALSALLEGRGSRRTKPSRGSY
jgi:hypothetical protein